MDIHCMKLKLKVLSTFNFKVIIGYINIKIFQPLWSAVSTNLTGCFHLVFPFLFCFQVGHPFLIVERSFCEDY